MLFSLTSDQLDLQRRARTVADEEIRPRAAHVDKTEEYPLDNIQTLVREKFMGMTIPQQYGGGGQPVVDAVLVIEQIARACGTTGRIVVEGNLGTVGAVTHLGSEIQKAKYLPWVCEGEKPAICITEPEAGSAATDMRTNAVLQGDDYVLNGKKWWITGAGTSRLYLVYTRFNGKPGAAGIGGLLLERDTPGFRIGKREPTMGLRGLNEGELFFEDCRAPRENLLIGEGGFKQLMSAYNGQRVGAATVALGLAQGAYEEAVRFSKERTQGGQPISSFQGLQWMLADMTIQIEAARLLIYRAAANAGLKFPSRHEAAVAKTFAGEMAIQVTNQALQFFGARGYSRDWPLERMVRDARMFTIGGGTAQVLRNIIAAEVLGERT
jgi:hypothetical protein